MSIRTVESTESSEEEYTKSESEEYAIAVEKIDDHVVRRVDRHIRWEIGIDTVGSLRGKCLNETIWTSTNEEADRMLSGKLHRLDHEYTPTLEGEEFGMWNQGDEKNAKNNY